MSIRNDPRRVAVDGFWLLDPNLSIPILRVRAGEMVANPTWREATAWAKANLRGAYPNEATGWTIRVGANGIQEGMHRLLSAGHPDAIQVIPELLRVAIPIHSGPDLRRRPDLLAVHAFVAPLSIGWQNFRALLTVWDTAKGHHYHGHQIEQMDTTMPGDLGEVRKHSSLGFSHPPGTLNVGYLPSGCNPFSTEKSWNLGEGLQPSGPPSESHPPDTVRLGLLLMGFKAQPP